MASRLNPAVSPQRRRRGRFVELRDGRTLKHALQVDRGFDGSDLTCHCATALDDIDMNFSTVERDDVAAHAAGSRRDERERRCGGIRRDDSLLH